MAEKKSRHYVNTIIQDPRNPKKGIIALIDIRGAKDNKDAEEIVKRAIPKCKVDNVTEAEVL